MATVKNVRIFIKGYQKDYPTFICEGKLVPLMTVDIAVIGYQHEITKLFRYSFNPQKCDSATRYDCSFGYCSIVEI